MLEFSIHISPSKHAYTKYTVTRIPHGASDHARVRPIRSCPSIPGYLLSCTTRNELEENEVEEDFWPWRYSWSPPQR